jgi:hypothetical protein
MLGAIAGSALAMGATLNRLFGLLRVPHAARRPLFAVLTPLATVPYLFWVLVAVYLWSSGNTGRV